MDTTKLMDDPEIRQWQRARALTGIAVLATVVAGIALVGATAPPQPSTLAVNCATIGIEGYPFDDTGAHAALCAGQALPARGEPEAGHGMPPPSATAQAEPLPPTF